MITEWEVFHWNYFLEFQSKTDHDVMLFIDVSRLFSIVFKRFLDEFLYVFLTKWTVLNQRIEKWRQQRNKAWICNVGNVIVLLVWTLYKID